MSKLDIAIAEIDRVMAAGVRFGCVLAGAGYGSGAAFRQALSERALSWAVGLSSRETVYPADVGLTFPQARGGRPRKYHIPDQAAVSVADMLADEPWRKIAWRWGAKRRLTCLFASRRVRIAEGHRHRMADNRVQSMAGDEVWLVGERRLGGEHKYYVSNLPPDTSLRQLAAAISAMIARPTAARSIATVEFLAVTIPSPPSAPRI